MSTYFKRRHLITDYCQIQQFHPWGKDLRVKNFIGKIKDFQKVEIVQISKVRTFLDGVIF